MHTYYKVQEWVESWAAWRDVFTPVIETPQEAEFVLGSEELLHPDRTFRVVQIQERTIEEDLYQDLDLML